MSDDEKIYEAIWNTPLEDYNDGTNKLKPKPPPRNGSVRTNNSENEDGVSMDFRSFEGESIDNLDILAFKTARNEKSPNSKPLHLNVMPFPKKPCFSELDHSDKLEYYGPISQLVQKLTMNKKSRYAVLISNRLILFEKPEHKVSKIQIPLTSITKIDWVDNINCSNKNDCNKFKLDTPVRPYKFQCSSHESAGLWINHIGKLVFDKQNFDDNTQSCILKATVLLENVKGKRIFTVEQKYTVAYYESEEDYRWGIAMHRIQLRTSGVKRDRVDINSFKLITSYREYRMIFESSSICNEWFQALSIIIQNAISSTICSTDAKSGSEIMSELGENMSNRMCAECQSTDVKWASINLFITLCPKCSGLHRGLGPNISKVQGIFTDESRWDDRNLIRLFQIIGNDRSNSFWMSNYHHHDERIEIVIDRKFINDKYGRKKFIEKREIVFDKYKDTNALNKALLESVKHDDVMRTMKLFHIGADLGNAVTIAEQYGQQLQSTFMKNQCKIAIKDWRTDLFELDLPVNNDGPFQERLLLCSINHELAEERLILIWTDCIEIVANDDFSRREVCKIDFRNICLVRENRIVDGDRIRLVVVVRDTEYSSITTTIGSVEFSYVEGDQSNDLRDFKNVIGQNMCPNFVPCSSFVCVAWVIVSTVSEDWKPCLLFLNNGSIVDLYDPMVNKSINIKNILSLDLRKVQKIEELRDNNYESNCPYRMYNLASICLFMTSSVIYHLRADTKEAHEEIYRAIDESWHDRVVDLLSDQFLTQNNVPMSIFKMIRYLQNHGTQIEGLFRRVGSVKEAEKIYHELITNPNSYVLANCEPHDVASALKLFFRKLRDPLLTNELHDHWVFAADLQNSEDKLKYYKRLVKSLPLVHYETLRLLIFLLVNIDKNNDITQMNPDNLGTSFNTCLLNGANNLSGTFISKNLQILPYLIRNYQDLFDVTQEELEIEEKYVKERKKIRDFPPIETSLLRQIYIDPELESHLRKDINFERESSNNNKKTKQLLSKQLRIEQSMTSGLLLKRLFDENMETRNIIIFEDRRIDDFHMHLLIYPQQNLIEVISNSESSDQKNNCDKKWIFKWNKHELGTRSEVTESFRCWAALSTGNKNKVYVELSRANQMNIWKNDQFAELLISLPTQGLVLFRSCESDRFMVAFEDRKNGTTNLPGLLNLFSFKPRSSFIFINFHSKLDYLKFLQNYDQSKSMEFEPKNRH